MIFHTSFRTGMSSVLSTFTTKVFELFRVYFNHSKSVMLNSIKCNQWCLFEIYLQTAQQSLWDNELWGSPAHRKHFCACSLHRSPSTAFLRPHFVYGGRTTQRQFRWGLSRWDYFVSLHTACRLSDHVSTYIDLNGRHKPAALVSH